MSDQNQESLQNREPEMKPQTSEVKTDSDQVIRTDGSAPKAKERSKLSIVQMIGLVCIALGIIIFLIPYFNDYLIRKNSQLDLSTLTAEQMAANLKTLPDSFNAEIEEIGLTNVWGLLGQYQRKEIIGQITLPAQQIDLAVFGTPSNANLLAGVAPLKSTQKMGEGNYTLSGHRAKGKGVLLHNLMDAQIGDRINLTNKQKIYVYRVVDAIQVDTDAVNMLDDSQTKQYGNRPIISIMTCYYGRASSRWFIIGTLEKVIPYTDAAMKDKQF